MFCSILGLYASSKEAIESTLFLVAVIITYFVKDVCLVVDLKFAQLTWTIGLCLIYPTHLC